MQPITHGYHGRCHAVLNTQKHTNFFKACFQKCLIGPLRGRDWRWQAAVKESHFSTIKYLLVSFYGNYSRSTKHAHVEGLGPKFTKVFILILPVKNLIALSWRKKSAISLRLSLFSTFKRLIQAALLLNCIHLWRQASRALCKNENWLAKWKYKVPFHKTSLHQPH